MNKKIIIIASIALIIDQISKIIATSYLKLNVGVKVIKNFFYLTLCHNEGAAWGLFSNARFIIIIGTVAAIILIYHYIYVFKENLRNNLAFGLLTGGLAGNLIDRIIFGYVRDFLDFYIFKYDYPIFNIADMCIVVGVFLLIISIIKGDDKHEDNSNRSKRKTRQVPSE
ncbi:MAG: signal peptidase II [Bacilli bacterium]|nr:signal peptidase II [Bacilli bacterium]